MVPSPNVKVPHLRCRGKFCQHRSNIRKHLIGEDASESLLKLRRSLLLVAIYAHAVHNAEFQEFLALSCLTVDVSADQKVVVFVKYWTPQARWRHRDKSPSDS